MSSFQPNAAFQALRMLSDAATRHRNDIQSYATGPSLSDSEDDDSSSSPVMDAFYANGGADQQFGQALRPMCCPRGIQEGAGNHPNSRKMSSSCSLQS